MSYQNKVGGIILCRRRLVQDPHNKSGVAKVTCDIRGNGISDVYHVASSIANLSDYWSLSWVSSSWVGYRG